MQDLFKNKIVRFLLLAGGLYVVWLLVYNLIIQEYTLADYHLNYNIIILAQELLGVFGVQTFIDIESDHIVLVMNEGNFRPILLGDACNGFKLFSIFSIFIIAFPGDWKRKAWFIPMGIVLVHLANVLRVAVLLLINNYYPQYMDFNHLYTFTIFVYGIIFLLWYWYAKKFSNNEQEA